ncbi:MAG TPA: phosphoglycerate kinase [Chitinophagales bacterium]|nr:phosphoglycerate kinase [Chitinophagales bacterium]HNL84842.1 phosphoglycerate kinase [Chitinophagales bacterium]
MKSIDAINFKNERALIRVDFNVPFDKQFNITDDTRIRAALPTINKVLNDGGSVVLMSHLGRPLKKLKEDGSLDVDKFTLRHIVKHLSELLQRDVKFADDCVSDASLEMSTNLKNGDVLLLENTRFHKEEEKGEEQFSKTLAKHGTVYINDAFGTAHRAHGSTTIVAHSFPADKKYLGYLMSAEVANADKVLHKAEKPFTAIIGGAKVSDKILIIENLLNIADTIIIGGGMAYTFFKAQGGEIGNSLVEADKIDVALEVLEKAKAKGVQLLLPLDSVIADKFADDAQTQSAESNAIPADCMALDIGEKAIAQFSDVIKHSKTILWNGPMGVFEMEKFQNGTKQIALAIAEATASGAFSLIGGGDSVAAINKFNLQEKVSYVSTGGGALLEFFEGKTLPGVAAIL